MGKNSLIQHFSPAWFAAVMGTGGFANVLYLWGNKLPLGHILGIALAWFNAALFIIFLIPWVVRWFVHLENLKKDLAHPIMGNFFVTMPIGLMIVGTNLTLMGNNFFSKQFIISIAFLAWLIGVLGALGFGLYSSFNMMRSEQTLPPMINLAWLISPVASIVLPLIGNPLVNYLNAFYPAWAKTVLMINLSFWGIGFLLFLFIGSIVFNRLAQHPLPPAPMAPTFWILLGPIGVGTITLMGLADSAKLLGLLSSTELSYLLATIIWGLGFWALGLALVISRHYLKNGGIPFSLSWWAFIFPLAAYTMASLKVGSYFGSGLAAAYSALLTLLLAVLWVISFVRTLGGILNGFLLKPPANPNAAKG